MRMPHSSLSKRRGSLSLNQCQKRLKRTWPGTSRLTRLCFCHHRTLTRRSRCTTPNPLPGRGVQPLKPRGTDNVAAPALATFGRGHPAAAAGSSRATH